jgi:hypothetical protein
MKRRTLLSDVFLNTVFLDSKDLFDTAGSGGPPILQTLRVPASARKRLLVRGSFWPKAARYDCWLIAGRAAKLMITAR